jgi:hypothetical protein
MVIELSAEVDPTDLDVTVMGEVSSVCGRKPQADVSSGRCGWSFAALRMTAKTDRDYGEDKTGLRQKYIRAMAKT